VTATIEATTAMATVADTTHTAHRHSRPGSSRPSGKMRITKAIKTAPIAPSRCTPRLPTPPSREVTRPLSNPRMATKVGRGEIDCWRQSAKSNQPIGMFRAACRDQQTEGSDDGRRKEVRELCGTRRVDRFPVECQQHEAEDEKDQTDSADPPRQSCRSPRAHGAGRNPDLVTPISGCLGRLVCK